MRVRILVGLAMALALGALALDMSSRAPRIAGTDHINFIGFWPEMLGHQRMCQGETPLPAEAGSVRFLVGTYGRPMPPLSVRFLGHGGKVIAHGHLQGGGQQGMQTVPLNYPHGETVGDATMCIYNFARRNRKHKFVIAGDEFAPGPGADKVDGTVEHSRIALVFLRPGRESWWDLLPTLARRMGYGKAAYFGVWALPLAAFLMALIWFGVARLLSRELR